MTLNIRDTSPTYSPKQAFQPAVTALVLGLFMSGCAQLPFAPSLPGKRSSAADGSVAAAYQQPFQRRLYGGFSAGASQLEPDTSNTLFTVASEEDTGNQFRIGIDLNPRIAAEIDTSVLGESELEQASTSVEYSAATLSLLAYGLSRPENRWQRLGWNPYARLGYGHVDRSSQVIPLDGSDDHLAMGAGVEYGFRSGLAVRADYTQFDNDASFLGLGLVYRFKMSPGEVGRTLAEASAPIWASEEKQNEIAKSRSEQVVIRDRDESSVVQTANSSADLSSGGYPDATHMTTAVHSSSAQSNEKSTGFFARLLGSGGATQTTNVLADYDNDRVGNQDDICPNTAANVVVDQQGCGLFDMILEDVTFKSGSAWLTPRARGQLDEVAELLLAFPEVRVGVIAHTDSQGPADINQRLSLKRAEVVANYLQGKGVHELQLEPEGHGEAKPIDSNADAVGRRRNRRVELITRSTRPAEEWRVARQGRVHQAASAARAVDALGHSERPVFRPATPAGRVAVPVIKTPRTQLTPDEPSLSAALPAARTSQAPLDKASRNANRLQAMPAPKRVRGFNAIGVIDGIEFAAASSQLTGSARDALSPLIETLKKHPDVRVAIMAHTDNQGGREQNYNLSVRRAIAVRDHVVSGGIASERLLPEGYGEALPLVQNVTDADRARNRRIEIRIVD